MTQGIDTAFASMNKNGSVDLSSLVTERQFSRPHTYKTTVSKDNYAINFTIMQAYAKAKDGIQSRKISDSSLLKSSDSCFSQFSLDRVNFLLRGLYDHSILWYEFLIKIFVLGHLCFPLLQDSTYTEPRTSLQQDFLLLVTQDHHQKDALTGQTLAVSAGSLCRAVQAGQRGVQGGSSLPFLMSPSSLLLWELYLF